MFVIVGRYTSSLYDRFNDSILIQFQKEANVQNKIPESPAVQGVDSNKSTITANLSLKVSSCLVVH